VLQLYSWEPVSLTTAQRSKNRPRRSSKAAFGDILYCLLVCVYPSLLYGDTDVSFLGTLNVLPSKLALMPNYSQLMAWWHIITYASDKLIKSISQRKKLS
jgi:membrane associated rhomboid family serine protease